MHERRVALVYVAVNEKERTSGKTLICAMPESTACSTDLKFEMKVWICRD
jgi:hypothetical protein